MSQRTKQSRLDGLIAVGVGATIGSAAAMPLLAMKNPIGFLGPIAGVIIAGLIHRRQVRRDERLHPTTARDENTDTIHDRGPPLGIALTFLLLGPAIAAATGAASCFAGGDSMRSPYFFTVLSMGVLVGIVGFVGSMFITPS